MAKHLSMEDLIKKYQYLQSTRQDSPGLDIHQNTYAKNSTSDNNSSKYSKSSPISNDKVDASACFSTSSNESSLTLTSEEACKVCLDAEANCAFIDCGHIVSCLNCAKLLTRCPICRETIKRTLRIYKS
ncbi:unnamed protein product [Adineta steineri]|uniref:RING-type domain-containing protein n=2 Tax=Adineta steineri TaxID=433720 RepID=A0A819AZT7_9BILA|nr:unnamed protein product [Adineta steineri]